jgi:quercetin dioxygenase-like cupin family protein
MPYALRLTEDTFAAAGARHARPLPALNRVLYVLAGDLTVTSGGTESRVAAGTGWHSPGSVQAAAGGGGATVLRYELVREPGAPPAVEPHAGITSRPLLAHPIDLDPAQPYLMRNDRVDFEPGGEALPHRHKGGGIRCLIEGSMLLRIEAQADRTIKPGQAWFESGREPVYAAGDRQTPTAFVRVSILPRAIRGQSSIMYVDAADAARSRPRKYTVYVDEPIEIV